MKDVPKLIDKNEVPGNLAQFLCIYLLRRPYGLRILL